MGAIAQRRRSNANNGKVAGAAAEVANQDDFNDWISLPFSSAARYRSIAMGPPIPAARASKYRTERYVSVEPEAVLNRTFSMLRSARASATELFVVPKSMPIPLCMEPSNIA